MKGVYALVGIVVLALVVGLAPQAAQAQANQFMWDLRLQSYFSTFTATQNGWELGRYRSTMFGASIKGYKPMSRFGFGAEFLTGGQHSLEGEFLFAEPGRNTIFGAWASYNLLPPESSTSLNLLAGWGKNKWSVRPTFQENGVQELTFRATGPMVGASFYAPLGPNFDLGGRVTWIPSAWVGFDSLNGRGSVLDYMVTLNWQNGPWGVGVGYRVKRDYTGNLESCPQCEFTWSGYLLQVSYRQ